MREHSKNRAGPLPLRKGKFRLPVSFVSELEDVERGRFDP
jgi:hypothetical protein